MLLPLKKGPFILREQSLKAVAVAHVCVCSSRTRKESYIEGRTVISDGTIVNNLF